MFQNYGKKFSIDNYNGTTWGYGTGFEEVVTNGISTFYVVDISSSRVVKFDYMWNYQTYFNLPFPSSYTLKYVGGYYYFSANHYFYKTKTDFTLASPNSYINNANAGFRQFVYDETSTWFYVAAPLLNNLNVFDKNCAFIKSISLSYSAYGLALYSGMLYVSFLGSYKIASINTINNAIINYLVTPCLLVSSVYVQQRSISGNGGMVISCENSNLLYNLDSGLYFNTSSYPYVTSIDSYGRFISITQYSVDIYF